MHFTEVPEIQHFATVKVSKNDNVYGTAWGNLVREYLTTAYAKDDVQTKTVDSEGVTYKIMNRGEVTSFYDADGNTLFDVENKRLEKEYEWLKKGGAVDVAENMYAKGGNDTNGIPGTGNKREVSLKEDNSTNKAVAAKKKYENSMKACKLHEKRYFEGPIKEHMFHRFEEDGGFCEDFLQEQKTFQKCIKYMIEKARESVPKSEMQAMVEGSVYLEWMEDYFRKDDKAEEEKKAKKAAGDKAKREKSAAERKTAKAKGNVDKTQKVSALLKTEAPKAPSKPKKNGKEMDGQLDLFAMMGM